MSITDGTGLNPDFFVNYKDGFVPTEDAFANPLNAGEGAAGLYGGARRRSKSARASRQVMKTFGSRRDVMESRALKTSGGLSRKDLFYQVDGAGVRRIKSKKASQASKKQYKYLVRAGYKAKKGVFASGTRVARRSSGGATRRRRRRTRA